MGCDPLDESLGLEEGLWWDGLHWSLRLRSRRRESFE